MNDMQSKLVAGLEAVALLIDESQGVFGLHLNGDPSPWEELRSGGKFEDWLNDFDSAMEAVAELKMEEQARIQHEIRMTDDPIYRDWYKKEQKRKEIEEHGINEQEAN